MTDTQGLSPDTTPDHTGVVFDEYYFQHDCGVPYRRDEHWLSFFGRVVGKIVELLAPSTVLDAGCALGIGVEAFRELGVAAWGVDISEYAIESVHESVRPFCFQGSLSNELPECMPRRYDLVVCIEVVEHVPPAEVDVVLDQLCAASDAVLLSSSPEDYREATHVSVHPPEYWSGCMARRGFVRDVDVDLSFLTPWAALYRRSSAPDWVIVQDLERQLWHLRHEVVSLRAEALAMQSRLTASESGHSALEQAERRHDEEVSRLEAEADRAQSELVRRELEILRLRDHAVGAEAELGQLRGEVKVLEGQIHRHAHAVEEYEARMASALGAQVALDGVRNSRSWKLLWGVLSPYRSARRLLRR